MNKLLRSAILTAVFGVLFSGVANARIYDSPSISTANNSGTMGLSGSFHFGTSTAPIGARTIYLVISGTGGIVGDFGITMGTGTFNTVRVGSMTSYGTVTSSVGFKGGSSTFTFISGDGRFLTNLATSTLANAALVATDTTTLKSRIDDHSVFISTAQPKIDSWTLSQSTISSRLDNLDTSTATLTPYSVVYSTWDNLDGRVSALESAPPSGGGSSGSGYKYYTYVVGDYDALNVSSLTVNYSSNTLWGISQAITAIGNNYGSIRVLAGTYTAVNGQTIPSVPKNITVDFEKGAKINSSLNQSVIINSGTINNIWINFTSNWAGNYGVWQRTGGIIDGLKFTGTVGYTAATTDYGAWTARQSSGSLTKNIDIDVQTNQAVSKSFIMNTSNSTGAIIDGGRYNQTTSQSTQISISGTYGAVIKNVSFSGVLGGVIYVSRANVSSACVITGNSFYQSPGSRGAIYCGDGYGFRTGNVAIKNNIFRTTTLSDQKGIELMDEADNWDISDNNFSGYATGVLINSVAIKNTKVHGNTFIGCTAGLTDNGLATLDRDNVFDGAYIAE